jgi:competence protein ComEC
VIQPKNRSIDLRGLMLVTIAGAWLVGILLAAFFPLPPLALLPGAAAALVFIVLLRHDRQGQLAMGLVLCALLGAWRYSIASPANDPQAITHSIGISKLEVRGTIPDEPTLQGRTRVLIVAVSQISRDGGATWQNADGQISVRTLGTLVEDPYGANYGDSVDVQGKLQPPDGYSPPDVFASMAFPRISVDASGGNPIIAFLYHLRVALANGIARSLPDPEAALLIAILLSVHTPALKALTDAFNQTGTAHLIAPSGFKVTVLAGLIAGSTSRLYEDQMRSADKTKRLLPAQRRGGWRSWCATGLILLSIAAYTLLSGAGPAAIRAGIMGTLLFIAPRIGRTYNIYTALALTALLMSLFDPFALWDVGFQLSFLGTLGIVLLTPFFLRLLQPIERLPLGHHIAEISAVTLAAEAATLPIIALNFQVISFIAPVTNVLSIPLLSVLILLGLLTGIASLIAAPLGALCGWIAYPLVWYVHTMASWCASLPGAYTSIDPATASSLAWIYYTLLTLATIVIIKGQSARAPTMQPAHAPHPVISRRIRRIIQVSVALLVILAMGTAALASQSSGQLTTDFLNVGPASQPAQGEAIFLRTPDGKTMLIDGGPDAASLAQVLQGRIPFWQRSLDLILLTSPKTDHITGLQDIVNRYSIGEVIDAGMLHPSAAYTLWRRTISERNLHYQPAMQGMSLPVGAETTLQILWPGAQLHRGSSEEIDNALALRLVTPGLRVLFLGVTALSKYALSGMLSSLDPNFFQADVVQIVGEPGKIFPAELATLLQLAHPALLVITPAALSPKQRKAGATTIIAPSPSIEGSWQIIQTARTGTAEISSSPNGWNVSAQG